MSSCWSLSPDAVMRSALRWKRLASSAMGFGTVAENIRVRRSAGAAARMNSRSSRKPRSSISSASSSTTARSSEMSSEPRVMWSRRRPGVPTTICAPCSSARRSWRMSMPPTQDAEPRAGILVEPFEFAADLDGEFARRRDDQGARRAGAVKAIRPAKQRRRDGNAERDGLARAGLRRDEQIRSLGLRREDRRLDGSQRLVATRCKRSGQCRNHFD